MRSELTGAVGEPVVLNLRKNRTRELPTESSKNRYDSRIFFSFLIIDYLYVQTYVKFVNCDCHINSNHFLLSISMHRKPYFHSRNRVMIIHVDDCVFPSILQKWDKLLTNYIILTYVQKGRKIVEFKNFKIVTFRCHFYFERVVGGIKHKVMKRFFINQSIFDQYPENMLNIDD